jgi:hypothetical protein
MAVALSGASAQSDLTFLFGGWPAQARFWLEGMFRCHRVSLARQNSLS